MWKLNESCILSFTTSTRAMATSLSRLSEHHFSYLPHMSSTRLVGSIGASTYKFPPKDENALKGRLLPCSQVDLSTPVPSVRPPPNDVLSLMGNTALRYANQSMQGSSERQDRVSSFTGFVSEVERDAALAADVAALPAVHCGFMTQSTFDTIVDVEDRENCTDIVTLTAVFDGYDAGLLRPLAV